MTRKDYVAAASQVSAIREGYWTMDLPTWADDSRYVELSSAAEWENASYTRAVQTAEAYILLFANDNPRFNQKRFLRACGLDGQ